MASETNDTLVAKKAGNLDVLHRAFSLYFQYFVPHLPGPHESVLFNRS